jgi:toxin YoeB
MNVTFTDDSWQEYLDWQTTDKKVLKKINALIKDIKRDSFGGIGKPKANANNLI